jgi:hypothetical protein
MPSERAEGAPCCPQGNCCHWHRHWHWATWTGCTLRPSPSTRGSGSMDSRASSSTDTRAGRLASAATGSLRPGPQARSTRTGCRRTTGCPPWITTASAHSGTCNCSCWGIHWRWRPTQLRANASCSYLHQSLGSPEPGRQGATKCNRRLEETQRDSSCSQNVHRHRREAQPRTRNSGRSSFNCESALSQELARVPSKPHSLCDAHSLASLRQGSVPSDGVESGGGKGAVQLPQARGTEVHGLLTRSTPSRTHTHTHAQLNGCASHPPTK